VFVYEKNGMKFLRSSADLTTEEMSKCIERFREFSAGHGFPIPPANNPADLLSLENEIEKQSRYL
jgi:hypothetical protein